VPLKSGEKHLVSTYLEGDVLPIGVFNFVKSRKFVNPTGFSSVSFSDIIRKRVAILESQVITSSSSSNVASIMWSIGWGSLRVDSRLGR
jgi:hypothetical protein